MARLPEEPGAGADDLAAFFNNVGAFVREMQGAGSSQAGGSAPSRPRLSCTPAHEGPKATFIVVRSALESEVLTMHLPNEQMTPQELVEFWEEEWDVRHARRIKLEAPPGSPSKWLSHRLDLVPLQPTRTRLDCHGMSSVLSALCLAFRRYGKVQVVRVGDGWEPSTWSLKDSLVAERQRRAEEAENPPAEEEAESDAELEPSGGVPSFSGGAAPSRPNRSVAAAPPRVKVPAERELVEMTEEQRLRWKQREERQAENRRRMAEQQRKLKGEAAQGPATATPQSSREKPFSRMALLQEPLAASKKEAPRAAAGPSRASGFNGRPGGYPPEAQALRRKPALAPKPPLEEASEDLENCISFAKLRSQEGADPLQLLMQKRPQG